MRARQRETSKSLKYEAYKEEVKAKNEKERKQLQDKIQKRSAAKNSEETERLYKITFSSKRLDRWDQEGRKNTGAVIDESSDSSGRSPSQNDDNYFNQIDEIKD